MEAKPTQVFSYLYNILIFKRLNLEIFYCSLDNSTRRAVLLKKALVFELLAVEIVFLAVLEGYKYYISLNAGSLLSAEFLKGFAGSFSFFYAGNLFWLVIFLFSLTALINLLRNIDKVSDRPLKIVLTISVFLLVLLAFSILLPTTHIIDEFTGKFIQLNAKGTKTASMSLLTGLKIFQTVSLCVISFSVLKKYYVFRSIWITITLAIGLFSIVFMMVYFHKDDQKQIEEQGKRVDAGIILGAAVWGGNRPSPILRERINKGSELYKNGVIKNIVLTGGGAPGEMTEAEVSKNELIKRGIDEKYIFIENQSNSTLEQITYINDNFYKKAGWDNVILISDNFHLFRAKQICRFFKMNAYTVSSDTPLSAESDFSFCMKESFAVMLFWLFGIG